MIDLFHLVISVTATHIGHNHVQKHYVNQLLVLLVSFYGLFSASGYQEFIGKRKKKVTHIEVSEAELEEMVAKSDRPVHAQFTLF